MKYIFACWMNTNLDLHLCHQLLVLLVFFGPRQFDANVCRLVVRTVKHVKRVRTIPFR